jgi:anaerobic ribonucleoside-triphosphate reductase activating protein
VLVTNPKGIPKDMNLKVNFILSRSKANGPGMRYTIWVQGCSIHCPGCSNTDTWDPEKGIDWNIDDLLKDIELNRPLDGITITGGEPLDQFGAVSTFLKKLSPRLFLNQINVSSFSAFLTTGYTEKQIRDRGQSEIFNLVDILCTGPFEKDKICSGEWKGSSNQEILYLTATGQKQSQLPVILKEIHIGSSGQSLETGFSA